MSQSCRTLCSGKEPACMEGLFSSDGHAGSEQQDELFTGTCVAFGCQPAFVTGTFIETKTGQETYCAGICLVASLSPPPDSVAALFKP